MTKKLLINLNNKNLGFELFYPNFKYRKLIKIVNMKYYFVIKFSYSK